MVGIREDTKENVEKGKLSLGLGATKPIDHTRARMVSRLAEIKAEVMCCMSTATVKHSRHAQSPGSSLPETRGQLTANGPHPCWPGFY